jgi:uncharacterized protein YpmB
MWYNKKKNIIKIIVVILVVIVGFSSAYFLGDDNALEEIAEEVIQQETGLNIDLTPNSLELKK